MFRLRLVGSSIACLLALSAVSCTAVHGQGYSVGISTYAPAPIAYPPVVVCAPAKPIVVCPPPKIWIPGHYQTIVEQVYVPGCVRQVWVAPVFATRFGFRGHKIQVCVTKGYWKTVRDPGHYEAQSKQVWIAGHWR